MSQSRRFYQYSSPTRASSKLWAYRRVYKGKLLRKKGFATKAQAEAHLLQAMQDMDAAERGEIRVKPTTMQDALDLFKRKQDVRAVEKSYSFGVHAHATINRLQEFVDQFGPGRLVREVTAEDIKEWMHYHTQNASQSTACTYVGRLMGMLKYARRTKADLHNWMPPEVKYEKKIMHSGRIVDHDEYEKLVTALLNPKRPDVQKCSHWSMRLRAQLWREAADLTHEFDRQIARACRQAGKQAKIAYGRFAGEGFTLHSLRHTYITHLLANGVDAPTVMQLSGHKSYQSFSVYLHKTDLGEKRACLILEKVPLIDHSRDG